MAEFIDEILQPGCDPWLSVDFHDRAKIRSDLTKAYKNIRLASSVETEAEVTVSPENLEKPLPQRQQPAQRPRIDLNKTSKATSAKFLRQNFVRLVLVIVMIGPNLFVHFNLECCNFVDVEYL